MHFTYEGFTQHGGKRNFLFLGTNDEREKSSFCINVELALLLENHVAVQDAPLFCQELLSKACANGSVYLDRLHSYEIVTEDLRPILIDRASREAKKRLQRSRTRYRKPSAASNVVLDGASDAGRRSAV